MNADHLTLVRDEHQVILRKNLTSTENVAVLVVGLHRDDPFSTATLLAIIGNWSSLSVTAFGDGQDFKRLLILRVENFHGHNQVPFVETHTDHAASRTAHRANVAFAEANAHTGLRTQEDVVRAVRDFCRDQFIAVIDRNCVNPCGSHIREITERSFLDDALTGNHCDVLVLFEFANRKNRFNLFAGSKSDQVHDRLSFGCA